MKYLFVAMLLGKIRSTSRVGPKALQRTHDVTLLQVGGVPAVLKYLLGKGYIDGSCLTVTGAAAQHPPQEGPLYRPLLVPDIHAAPCQS